MSSWLNNLKVAVVQKDTVLLTKLFEDIPQLSDPKEIQTALYLTEEAKKIITTLKDETQTSMIKMKKYRVFKCNCTANASKI